MKIRQGRKNKHNLYLQLGDEPSDKDVCLGLIIDPEVAIILADAANEQDADIDIKHAIGVY